MAHLNPCKVVKRKPKVVNFKKAKKCLTNKIEYGIINT